jgi:phospholipid transport system substrate-binding protein
MKAMGKMMRLTMVSVLCILIFSGQALAAPATPLEQLRESVEAILAVMQNKELSGPGRRNERRERILALVQERFDFTEMSKRTLGKSWKKRSAEEQQEFEGLFADLLKNTYIGRIEAYSDEKVDYAKEVFSRNDPDRARVYTNILKNGREIPINYSLLKKGDEWFVYDVLIEGVSLVRNYRSEFQGILDKEDFAGLIERMREKIEINEAKREK